MPTTLVQQAIWTGLGGREDGDKIERFAGSLARFGHRASEWRDLRDKRPGRSQIGMHLGTDLDGAHLEASPSAVYRLRLEIACLRIGEIGRQVRIERGLVAFDGQDGLGLQLMPEAQELGVGVQGISRTHPAFQWATSAAPAWRPGSQWFSRPHALARTFPDYDG